jgi:hypothetical protein
MTLSERFPPVIPKLSLFGGRIDDIREQNRGKDRVDIGCAIHTEEITDGIAEAFEISVPRSWTDHQLGIWHQRCDVRGFRDLDPIALVRQEKGRNPH